MKKIFTLISGLILMSALTAKADTIKVWVMDYEANEVASPFETELTKDADGNYVIADFFNSYTPVKFKFEKPAVGKYSDMVFTGHLDKSQTYPYLLDDEDNYLVCAAWNYDNVEDWTYIYYPYVADGEYSYIYGETSADSAWRILPTVFLSASKATKSIK